MKLGQWFEMKSRELGESFVTLKDGHPEWLKDAIHEAHNTDLPNDWIYIECEKACRAIDDGSLKDNDDVHEHADLCVDIYTRDLYQWAADMCHTSTYSNARSEADEFAEPKNDPEELIKLIQFCAIRSIAARMLEAARENAGES